jgi:hypothetical protein
MMPIQPKRSRIKFAIVCIQVTCALLFGAAAIFAFSDSVNWYVPLGLGVAALVILLESQVALRKISLGLYINDIPKISGREAVLSILIGVLLLGATAYSVYSLDVDFYISLGLGMLTLLFFAERRWKMRSISKPPQAHLRQKPNRH